MSTRHARIVRRQLAFDDHGHFERGRRVFDRGDQLQVVFDRGHRRQEHVQSAVARLDAQRRPHDPGGRFAQLGHAVAQRNTLGWRGRSIRRDGTLFAPGQHAAQLHSLGNGQRTYADASGSGGCRNGYSAAATQGKLATGSRKPIGESPGVSTRCLPRSIHRPLSQAVVSAASKPRCSGNTITHRLVQSALEDAPQASPLFGVLQLVVGRIDVDRQLPFAVQEVNRVFERRHGKPGIDRQPLGQQFDEIVRRRRS